jgi:regulator of sirC expression with transglutaminase-like and TPR domain
MPRSKILHMKAFHSGREAKEFLISKIVAEAEHENVPLSEVECKMLYFTESGWALPNIMKVSEDFDREYDPDEYEQKIAKLVTQADKRIREGSRDDYDRWWAAIRFLQGEDHYISVMIRLAGRPDL